MDLQYKSVVHYIFKESGVIILVRKRLSNDAVCVVVNNTFGAVVHNDDRTAVYLTLYNRGDETELTIGQLRSLVAKNKPLLEGLSLLIVDVDDSNLSVQDVADALGLSNVYKSLNGLIPNKADDSIVESVDLENFVLKSSAERFEEKINAVEKRVAYCIIELAIELFKRGELSDYNKMRAIQKITQNDYLFEDAENSALDEAQL